jgi:hypothetical protein
VCQTRDVYPAKVCNRGRNAPNLGHLSLSGTPSLRRVSPHVTPLWQNNLINVIIIDMSELLLPAPDSSRNQFLNVTASLGVPLDVYRGYFVDGDKEIRVIVDTTDHPRIEDGELYSDPTHRVSVSEVMIDGTKRKIPSPDAGRYPFSERVDRDSIRLPLIKMLEVPGMVILQGPNWRDTEELI